jgi:hypothetical protein
MTDPASRPIPSLCYQTVGIICQLLNLFWADLDSCEFAESVTTCVVNRDDGVTSTRFDSPRHRLTELVVSTYVDMV